MDRHERDHDGLAVWGSGVRALSSTRVTRPFPSGRTAWVVPARSRPCPAAEHQRARAVGCVAGVGGRSVTPIEAPVNTYQG